jgi:hypothetical protein
MSALTMTSHYVGFISRLKAVRAKSRKAVIARRALTAVAIQMQQALV